MSEKETLYRLYVWGSSGELSPASGAEAMNLSYERAHELERISEECFDAGDTDWVFVAKPMNGKVEQQNWDNKTEKVWQKNVREVVKKMQAA